MWKSILLVGAGGFVGSCLRYLVAQCYQWLGWTAFPWGTLTVNVAGSLLIGLLLGLAERTQLLSQAMTLLLVTGFCGGFTTFSTFSNESYMLLEQKQITAFICYAALTFCSGLAAVLAGRALAHL